MIFFENSKCPVVTTHALGHVIKSQRLLLCKPHGLKKKKLVVENIPYKICARSNREYIVSSFVK